MKNGFGRCAALALAAALFAAGPAAAAAQPAPSLNPANDKLLKMSPSERSAALAHIVGHWCIGTEAFLMGVVSAGPGRGNAYWSLRCVDASAWAVQIDPLGEVTAIGCDIFKANGAGKECFKKF
ncbi:MAG TPA: hypothetical protein VND95_01525 [Stellaceae bacterium]|nr:hypothetical protein [Stellaceae bacterium]